MSRMQAVTTHRSMRAGHRARAGRWRWAPLFALLAGCGATEFQVQTDIPEPLIVRMPLVVGYHVPAAFREAVHREERNGTDYVIEIGRAQTAGFDRLMNAMFTRSVPVSAPNAGAATDPEIRGVLEPVLEEFSFVTPSDTGTPIYAVSLKYRINAYQPDGELVDSWSFTGYGTQAGSQVPGRGKAMLQKAATVAMRDAGAKIAVELREQAIVRGLIEAIDETPSGEIQPPP
jgi:hypothetical protein